VRNRRKNEVHDRLLTVRALGMLVNGVKRLEVEGHITGMDLGRLSDGVDDASTDGILVFGAGSVCGQFFHVVNGEGSVCPDGRVTDGE
jgi:hypothetical protein